MALTQVQGGMILPSTTLTTPIVATTIGVGGATPSASGSGITFPATASASTNANTLDDYEEGTWTPVIEGTSTAGTASYTAQNARYTKIGRMVCFEMWVSWSSGTGTGGLRISGLPFTTSNTQTYPSITIGLIDGVVLAANSFALAYLPNNNTTISLIVCPLGGGSNSGIAYDAAGDIQISGCYTV
jgi:hypothetical protein